MTGQKLRLLIATAALATAALLILPRLILTTARSLP